METLLSTEMSEQRIPPFYRRYIDLIDSNLIVHILEENGREMQEFARSWSAEMTAYRYQEGKWSAREVILHMIDAERIFACRALRFARRDPTSLPGFDENAYAETYAEDERPFSEILKEMEIVRSSTTALFSGFTEKQLKRQGTASGITLTVRELGEIIAGHEQHHRKILMERYFPE